LLGLEIFVARRCHTHRRSGALVANVLVLGLLVFIRTFLGWSLVVEIEERWLWQARSPIESTSARSTER
jgi:uncharacterized membrane protein